MGLQEPPKLLAIQTRLGENGRKRTARNVLSVWNDHKARATGGIHAAKGTMAPFALVRGLEEPSLAKGGDDLPRR